MLGSWLGQSSARGTVVALPHSIEGGARGRIDGLMSLLGFLILVVVAALAGSVGQLLGGFTRGGCLLAVVVGFVGAFLGQWIATQLELPPVLVLHIEGEPFPVVWAIIGAALLSAVLGVVTPRRG